MTVNELEVADQEANITESGRMLLRTTCAISAYYH